MTSRIGHRADPCQGKGPLAVCLAASLAAVASCTLQVPDDRSALVLTIEGEGESAQSRFVHVSLAGDGTGSESWGFLADDGLPYTYELWTRLEGDVVVNAEGYLCPGGECRGVEGRPDLLAGRGDGEATLAFGSRVLLTVVISGRCGNGIIEAGEECDAGESSGAAACAYPLRSVQADAGGEGDSFTAFPLGDGFAVAWTEGAGSDLPAAGEVGLMTFDANGTARPESPGSVAASCSGSPSLRLASPAITSWGDGGPSAILVYPEVLTETTCSLCFVLLDGSGGIPAPGALRAPAGARPPEGFPVLMIDDARAAVAGRQDGLLMLSVIGVADGEPTGRAEVETSVTGEELAGVSLVSLDGDFVAAAWREWGPEGTVLSMLGRWGVTAGGQLVPFDIAPVRLSEEVSAFIRGTGLAASGPAPEGRLVFVTTAGSAVEAVWLDKGSPQGDFVSVVFDAGLEPEAMIAGGEVLEPGAVHVLVARPSLEPGLCRFTLLRIPGPGGAGGPREVGSWGELEPMGCDAELLPLSGERGALIFRTLKPADPGAFRGELSVDIVATRG